MPIRTIRGSAPEHRHAIVREKKCWDKIILCGICVGPTGHISDKTSMTQHVKTDIGLDRAWGAREELIEVGREEKDKS